MELSSAAKRLVSLFKGIPADRKKDIGKAFDEKHAKELLKLEKLALSDAASELSQVSFKDRKKEDKKNKKKKNLKEELITIIDSFIIETEEKKKTSP